ncbi:50S ribosomal protein L11 [Candidatus Nomurabacteria bacterium RIFCSPLOWO2_01_FULL_36_10b]|uniref:Large ribosomal subunit protein uL11 n=1 Tax=Candidatus Nomurabacteria bacterium RIFCSPLOWO2_01_FULL_36_10b TaxID=1801766 RepID=A0A1F6WQK0_9BACT|nr:MAG: 50S ribosomal protein L11 [Candidatus Nomurabacteria bacterium RIFCSPLOWO2_01_FULL_36_10b]
MAKELSRKIKLQVTGGQANPAPPLGPALGGAGVNISEFVTRFNEATREQMGQKVSVVINVYKDRSFDFIIKTPPTSYLIIKEAGISSGSGKNTVSKAGKITRAQLKKIAEIKMPDLNANDIDSAMKIVEGQCYSMGIEVV